MAKQNPLLDYLLGDNNRDRRRPTLLTPNSERLRLAYILDKGGWNTVADYIGGLGRLSVSWFPDANVAFLDATTPVWQALRIAALGTQNGSTVISGVVEAEMAEWLDNPYRNKIRSGDIKSAIDGETWIRKFRIAPSGPLNAVLYNYTHLLGFRRSLAWWSGPGGATLVDTNAANKCDTMNAIRNKLGPRAQGLAKKGRDDAEANGVINIGDEMHCMMAILYALQNCRDTIILTADADYLEIFYKAQWFFDTHYRAWLAAKLIKAGHYGEPVKEMQDTAGYFDGPLTLYRRLTTHMKDVLPLDSRSVRVSVLYVAPDEVLHNLSFPFELMMLEMLKARAATGRCTDLFDSANVHIDLGPLSGEMDNIHLGVGNDATFCFETNGIRTHLGRLDLAHSACCFEGFA